MHFRSRIRQLFDDYFHNVFVQSCDSDLNHSYLQN